MKIFNTIIIKMTFYKIAKLEVGVEICEVVLIPFAIMPNMHTY